jgi:hypothetical protein
MEHKLKVRALRTDRGGEFTSNEFNDCCEKIGIKRFLMEPYTPQQNGVVERRNRTVVDMARSLLKSKNMPGSFWGQAITMAVYLLNQAPTKAVNGKTPYEAIYGRKPNVSHLRTFGCVAHVKTAEPHPSKLADRSTKMVFIGYERVSGTKAYRFYDPRTKHLRVSRDVVFEEKQAWNWSAADEAPNSHIFEVEFPTHDNARTDIQMFGDTLDHGDRGDHHDADTDDDDADTGEDTGNDATQDVAHGDHHHHEAQSDDDYHDDGHGHDDYADDMDAKDQAPSTPINSPSSSASIPSQFVSPPSQATTDPSGPRRYKTLTKVYEHAQPVTLEYSGLCLLGVEEPANFVEASKDPSWKHAMDEELKAIESNGTWSLVTRPPNHKAIGLKWVYKLKKDTKGVVVKHKARLVAKGYVQRQGVDYEEVFAPVARLETVRLFLALAAQEDWKVHHMDVKSAFLNGDLTEEVYVEQPIGYEKKGAEEKVYKLKKALYGLKQAPRAWNSKLDQCLVSLGFKRCPLEHAVYTRSSEHTNLLVGVYVDDLIITGDSTQEIEGFKAQMKKFSMSDLGLLSYYLGIEVKQSSREISLCQSAYAVKLLDKCGMADCNAVQVPMDQRHRLSKISSDPPVDTTMYRSIVGSLRYLVHTRPDLAYSVGIVSRFMENPTTEHMSAVKKILRYVKGTINLGCTYKKGKEGLILHGYSDSDMAGDVDDRKSTSGMVFYLGPNPISWNSQKQKVVALSSCEAEYIAASTAACQGVWLRRLLADLAKKEVQKVSLKIDNQAAISLCKNPVHHERSKHIDTRFHYIRECIEEGMIEVQHVNTNDQLADILTKSLGKQKFIEMRKKVGVQEVQVKQPG